MEDFGYLKYKEQDKSGIILKKALLIGGVLLSAACFFYITISAYYFVYYDQNSDIEIVKSPKNVIKVIKDQDNNGIVIKDMDKVVYENIVGGKKESLAKKNVNIIKTQKSPVAPPKEIKKSKKNIISHSRIIDEKEIVEDLEEETISKKTAEVIEEVIIEDINITQGPLSRVQIAALSSKESANEYWKKLNKKHSKLFSNLNPFIQKVDLGNKGIFYRLQVGNFNSQIAAENFCINFINKAQKSKADCIIVE